MLSRSSGRSATIWAASFVACLLLALGIGLSLTCSAPAADSKKSLATVAAPNPSQDPVCKIWPGADQKALYAFLDHYCYYGWVKDQEVRNTGPYINDDLDFGVHPAVRVYYSPAMWKWMSDGRKGPLTGEAMVVKEQYNTPAQQYAGMSDQDLLGQLCEWTVMVHAPKDSADGWFWADHGNPHTDATLGCADGKLPAKPTFDQKVEFELSYPGSGLGLYCLNCHASAVSERTYSATENVNGEPLTYLTVPPASGPAKLKKASFAAGFHAALKHRPTIEPLKLPDPLEQPSEAFLALYPEIKPVATKEVEKNAAMPPETYDHVVMPPHPDKAVQFATSDQCLGCHDPAADTIWHPPMLYPDQRTGQTVNLAPYGEWRASMMGLAGRDPIFFAQLDSELALHPGESAQTQDTCLHCHGVMGQRQFAHDTGGMFTRAQVNLYSTILDDNIKAPNKYGALAREGISCTVCHHISPDGLGTEASFTGNFKLDPSDEINGPFDHKVLEQPMKHALGITPKYGAVIKSAALCGSCHTIELPVYDGSTPVIDPKTGKPKMFLEQATYLEWKNSVYQDEEGKVNYATARTCQSCHMPQEYQGNPLTLAIAYIETGDFPDTENRMKAADITPEPRANFARHTLLGVNLFGLELFQQFPLILGIRTVDPMVPDSTQLGLVTATQSSVDLARHESAEVAITSLGADAGKLDAQVQITNLAGHKLPSGVGFRRAFVDFRVEDGDGNSLWESGATDGLGVILGVGGKPLKTEFFGPDQQAWQPPYDKIVSEDQVQIFQELVRNPKGLITTSFLALDQEIKDNRLLPRGWRLDGPDGERTKPCAWDEQTKDCVFLDKPGYNDGGGYDRLTYEVACTPALATAARVTATLYYQSIPPAYLKQRFTDAKGWDTKRLYYFGSMLNTEMKKSPIKDWKIRIASTSAELPAGGVCGGKP